MKQENDILQDPRLKAMRPKAPEGYFEELSSRMADAVLGMKAGAMAGTDSSEGHAQDHRWRPVTVILAAAAASLLVMLAAGAVHLSRPDAATGITEGGLDLTASASGISGDDIVEYLIWSGASLEEFADLIEE